MEQRDQELTAAAGVESHCSGDWQHRKSTARSKSLLLPPGLLSLFHTLYWQILTGSQMAKENFISGVQPQNYKPGNRRVGGAERQ